MPTTDFENQLKTLKEERARVAKFAKFQPVLDLKVSTLNQLVSESQKTFWGDDELSRARKLLREICACSRFCVEAAFAEADLCDEHDLPHLVKLSQDLVGLHEEILELFPRNGYLTEVFGLPESGYLENIRTRYESLKNAPGIEQRVYGKSHPISNSPWNRLARDLDYIASRMIRASIELEHERDPLNSRLEITDLPADMRHLTIESYHVTVCNNILAYFETSIHGIERHTSSRFHPILITVTTALKKLLDVVNSLNAAATNHPEEAVGKRARVLSPSSRIQKVISGLKEISIILRETARKTATRPLLFQKQAAPVPEDYLKILCYPTGDPNFPNVQLAHCLNFDVIGSGDTTDDALDNLEAMLQWWFDKFADDTSKNSHPFVAPARFFEAYDEARQNEAQILVHQFLGLDRKICLRPEKMKKLRKASK